MTHQIGGLAQILGEFDAVLVDQYGVLHDGQRAFSGALTCLRKLADRGIPAVVLTNSGKPGAFNAARLERLGFPAALFCAVVSSGDIARSRVQHMLAEGRLSPGDRVAVVSRGQTTTAIDDLGITLVEPGHDAELVLIAGAEPERFSQVDYAAMLAPLAARGVPAICANPDKRMLTANGPAFAAGVIAEDYHRSGGPVELIGKPGKAMFRAGLEALGGFPPARVLMIGDSPEHDIAGAAEMGLQTLLVTSGVQAGLACDVEATYAISDLAWDVPDMADGRNVS